LNDKDTIVQVQVIGSRTTTMDFILNPGQTMGRVFGEYSGRISF
jgi:hypothetical protein